MDEHPISSTKKKNITKWKGEILGWSGQFEFIQNDRSRFQVVDTIIEFLLFMNYKLWFHIWMKTNLLNI